MIRDRWTLLLIKGEESSVRQISVPATRARRLLVGFCAVVLLAVATVAGGVVEGTARVKARIAERKNALLTAELRRIRGRVTHLESDLQELVDEGGEVRALAGLEPLDEDVLQVGVGGPGTLDPGSNPLADVDAALGDEAFALTYDLNALERRARLLSESLSEASDSLASHQELLESIPSILPTAGLLSSRFSQNRLHPIFNRRRPHEGIDLSATTGTPILAAAKGRVVKAGWEAGLGLMVEIDHGHGYTTRYGHTSKVLVRVGQRVARGDLIAQVGSTGVATSSHLHYEVRLRGQAQNPMNYVLPSIVP